MPKVKKPRTRVYVLSQKEEEILRKYTKNGGLTLNNITVPIVIKKFIGERKTSELNGRQGGLKTLQSKGRKHFVQIAKARWAKVRADKAKQ